MRKIIQIAFDSHPQANECLHALCDDGSVWRLEHINEGNPVIPDASDVRQVWNKFPEIPQDQP